MASRKNETFQLDNTLITNTTHSNNMSDLRQQELASDADASGSLLDLAVNSSAVLGDQDRDNSLFDSGAVQPNPLGENDETRREAFVHDSHYI